MYGEENSILFFKIRNLLPCYDLSVKLFTCSQELERPAVSMMTQKNEKN